MSIQRLTLIFLLVTTTTNARVADLHSHLAAHLPYGFMLSGSKPDKDPPEAGTYTHRHWYKQQLYKEWMKNSGIQLFVMTAIPNVFAFNRHTAWTQVEEQLKYVEDFADSFPGEFHIATNPREARIAMDEGKIVFIHAIEGGEYLLDSQEDANHWAKRGLAMIGPIHLVDNHYGEASVMSGLRGILNWKGLLRSKSSGLKPQGNSALLYMKKAGLIIDGAHMASTSLDQTLGFAETEKIPLIISHAFFREIRDEERGLSKEQVRRLLAIDSLIGLALAGELLTPTSGPANEKCGPRSVADFQKHLNYFPGPVLALGSDFNGFIDHLLPCGTETGIRTPMDVPQLIEKNRPELWKHSAEKFLEIWEKVLLAK